MVFSWKEGSRHKVDPNIAGAVCAEMEAAGTLTADNLVEVSKPQNAPLHSEFEWNNTKAAEEWRKHQARHIINSLVVVTEPEEPAQGVRAFFKIEAREQHYESVVTIVQREDKYEALKATALRELIAIQRKYQQIAELGKVFAAIAELTGGAA